MRSTQNVYHPRMAEPEKPQTNHKPTTWPGAITTIAVCATVTIIVQMILDYRW